MTESKKRPLSVEEIFMRIRGDMGHTWPVGTFNQDAEFNPKTIEGESEVIDDHPDQDQLPRPDNPITRRPDNPSPEVTHG